MFYLLLITITLAAGFILHGVFSLAAMGVWRLCRPWLAQIAPRRSARLLFSLRMAPLAATTLALGFFVAPAFLSYEPRTTTEALPLALFFLAALAAVVLGSALYRTAKAVAHGNRIARTLSAFSRVEEIDGIPVYRCSSGFPVMAVLGIWRPRIFISEEVLGALDADELNAALFHEAVHVNTADVLKKALLHMAPCILPKLDGLKPISEEWARMCELSADEEAVAKDSKRKLYLASALVKVARLTSASAKMPAISAALLSDADALLGYRVRHLLEEPTSDGTSAAWGNPTARAASLMLGAGSLLLLMVFYSRLLSLVYAALEFLVHG